MPVSMDELKKYESVYKSSLDSLRLNVEVSLKIFNMCLTKKFVVLT